MKIKDVVKTLELFAPLPLQESYDNSGLQVGLTEAETSRVLLCLDVTEEVIKYAVAHQCNLIVAHHPLLFKGLKRVGDSTLVERCLRLAILNDITLYAAHTNLDNSDGGVSFQIAKKMGLVDVTFLREEGKFNDCPYGSGVIGNLTTPLQSHDFLALVQNVFQTASFAYSESQKTEIQKVAICGGSGDFLIQDAVKQGADAFITGEIGYHYYHGWESSLWLIATGHYESERYVPELMEQIIKREYPQLDTMVYPHTTSPIKHYKTH